MTPSWLEFGFTVENKGETPALFTQVHGKDAFCVDDLPPSTPADAGWTHSANRPVYVFTADCLPILLYSHRDGPVAAIHCGWRGALAGVVLQTVRTLDLPRQDLHAIVGPAIGECCFEIRQDFIDAFEKERLSIQPYLHSRGAKQFCNLLDFVLQTQLEGIQTDLSHHRCTVCSKPVLPSYRRNGKADPRIRTWIQKI